MDPESVDTVMSLVGVSKETAIHYLETVNGCLEDACFLDYCVSGVYPQLYSVFFGKELCPSSDLQLTITSAPPAAKATPATITEWCELSWEQIQHGTEEERSKGNLRADESEQCSVCLMEFTVEEAGQVVKLGKCKGHYFHKECISNAFSGAESLKCPVCGHLYGVQWGAMPPGTCNVSLHREVQCEGFRPGSWVLTYRFKDGTTPNGQKYSGTKRQAVLPDIEEGREVLRLLICAFYRRQTFVVGTSVTTGKNNTVIWNGIHHKTSVEGGPTNFGYPDPTYFTRVKEELSAKGINVKAS